MEKKGTTSTVPVRGKNVKKMAGKICFRTETSYQGLQIQIRKDSNKFDGSEFTILGSGSDP